MAQKDIEDIAIYMRQIDESKNAEQKAFDESCKECDDLQLKEDEKFEDEIIDKTSLGFIDDSDIEEDDEDVAVFLSPIKSSIKEDEASEEVDSFDEDVSDCLAKESDIDESENQGSITVEVYNKDGFGAHFAEEVEKYVPTVTVSTMKHILPNGDLEVVISGNVDDLKKAYAFYIGKEDFSKVSPEDKEEFNALLVYKNGDTIAEADYREAVAHCLDPIGVDASTANLADKDTCAISFIKEEKAKRLLKKLKTYIKENNASELSDDELDTIDDVTDVIQNDKDYKELSQDNTALMKLIVSQMGYTLNDWEKLSSTDKAKAWKEFEQSTKENTPVSDDLDNQVTIDAQDDEEEDDGEEHATDSTEYLRAGYLKKQAKERAAEKDKEERMIKQREAIRKASGKKDKGTWSMSDFYSIISTLTGKERKQLMKDLIADVEKDHADDPRKAGNEIMFLKELFNQKLTLRDFAKAWGATAPGVMKYHDNIISIWKDTCKSFGVDPDSSSGRSKFISMIGNPVTFEKFKTALRQNLDARKKGRLVKGL